MTARRLLTIGHSYAVAMNRRLAHALAREGAGRWEVTVAAPERVHTDRGLAPLQPLPGEAARLAPVPVRWPRRIHWMTYGGHLKSLLAQGWDVVHCWQEPFTRSAWQVARWTPEESRLVYATFQNLSKSYPFPFGLGERRAMARADGWIAFGHTVQAALRDRPGYAGTPHRVIPPPVDLDRFSPDPAARARVHAELGWSGEGPPVVGFAGRLVPEKGLRVLMAALDRCSGWRLLVIGDGPLRPALEAWAARHGGAVRIASGVGHDQVPGYLSAMDLLCLPSLTTPAWREQFGRVLIEAMASGVPVVGSDSGEIPYVIADAGVVVAEGNVEAWAAALEALLRDAGRRSRLADAGRARAASEFSLGVVAHRHLRFFEELAG
jgi:glycosyltransferase involved in cell wall biosynthesis